MLTQDQKQTQQQKIDPKIIMANTLLQLSGLEFQQAIERELAENPALELEDERPCTTCELAPFSCTDCQYNPDRQQFDFSDELTIHDFEYMFDNAPDSEDQIDPLSCVQAEVTLHEHLRTQLRTVSSGRLFEIADYLVNYINDSGYLTCDLLEITLELDATDEELEEAVSLIQTLDPPGVGARNLRECLLIQLKYLGELNKGDPVAYRMVQDFWTEIKTHKFARIARRLKVKPDRVRGAMKFIKTRLNPYPASGFRAPHDNKSSDVRTAVRPDVVIRRVPTGYEVEIVGNDHFFLTVNPHYREMYNTIKSNGRVSNVSAEEKKHIIEYVERADLFIKNLNQRRKTLRAIAKCIAEYQHGFLDTGSKRFLRPLTRVKLAEMVGLHESTVSRAVSEKYVQLPNQEVVPFDFFFQSAPSATEMIIRLIEQEDPAHPLSDQQIAKILTEQGYPIARRTVVKYREASKILSSRQRRR